VLLTAVYNESQAMLGAAAGVAYIAPYLGRMKDAGRPAHAEIAGMARALRGVCSGTKIVVASVRGPDDVVQLAQQGIECFALPPAVAREFFTEPLTDAAVEDFDLAMRAVTRAAE
jgi:transaldolase